MAPWRWRLTFRRARTHASLLAIVLVLSIVSASVLSTLYLLDRATATFAARTALDDVASAQTELRHTISVAGPVDEILAASARAAHQGLGDTPVTANVHIEGARQVLPLDGHYVLTYYASDSRRDDRAALIDGTWPQEGAIGLTQIAIPRIMSDDLDLSIGDVIAIKDRSYDSDPVTSARIVGIFLPIAPDGPLWATDTLRGAGYSPAVAVPGASGLSSPAYGPLLTSRDHVDSLPVSTITVTYQPDFSHASTEQLSAVMASLATASADATMQQGGLAKRVSVAAPVSDTIGRIVGSLTMTRSTVLVTALLLLVVATAALVQAARLLSERRHDERLLWAARGASLRQGAALGAIEAILIGVVTVGASAPLARLAYLTVSSTPWLHDAGLHRDPGLPLGVWVASTIIAAVLIIIVLAPLMRRTALLVEAEADRARPGRRAAFQKAGLDVAVLVLAGLAFWQLRLYHSPVVTGDEAPRLDPLLAAGPALALLAGALVAARLVPLAARLMEVLARSARRAITPLAAWEVSRRPVRALSAVLLLTLSLSVGVFASGFVATWTQSQSDQALYTHPVDAVVTAPNTPWMRQAQIVSFPGANPEPVLDDTVTVSSHTLTHLELMSDTFEGVDARILATNNAAWKPFGQGRLTQMRGETIAPALDTPAVTSKPGIEIPAGATRLSMDVTATAPDEALPDILVGLRALIRSQDGLYHTIDLGIVTADAQAHTVEASIDDTLAGATVTGLQVLIASTGDGFIPSDDAEPLTDIHIALSRVSALSEVAGWSVAGQPTPLLSDELDTTAVPTWTPSATVGVLKDVTTADGSVKMTMRVRRESILTDAIVGVLTAAPSQTSVPVVASDELMRQTRMSVGDGFTIRVGATLVRANLAAAVPRIGPYTAPTVAADLDTLQIATFQRGGLTRDVTTWWVSTPDQAAYAASLPPSVTVTTHDGVVDDLTVHALRIAIPASVWIVVAAAALLAALGFAVHIVVSTRSRALEIAQLRAVGLSNAAVVRMVGIETLLLAVLGTVCGLGIGLWLVTLAAPLVSFGPDGLPPVPGVITQIPWPIIGALALEAVVVVVLALAIAATLVRRIRPADLLRQGDAR